MAKMAKCGEWAIGEFAVLVEERRGEANGKWRVLKNGKEEDRGRN
jgi:hypothetical protein